MEEKYKDQKIGEIAAFQNSLELDVPFAFSHRSSFVYKKTEKLVVATNLVAGLIKDNVQLSEELRSKTFELLTSVSRSLLGRTNISSVERHRSVALALAAIAELQTLCDVGYFSKHISEMNSSVIKKEFALLYKTIVEEGNLESSGAILLTQDFFAENEPEFHKGHDKEHSMSFTKPAPQAGQRQVSHIKSDRVNPPVSSGSSENRLERRALIVKLIKEKGEVGVNDLLGTLKGVGGKTVQRELLAMVAEGVLKKQGERRWSRYSII